MGPSAVQPVQFRQHRKGSEWNMAPGVIRGAIEGNIRKSHLNALQTGCGSDAAFGTPPDMDVPFSVLERTPHQPSQPPMDTVRGKPHSFPIRGPTGIVMRYWGTPLPEHPPEAVPGPYESLPGGRWPGHGQSLNRGHQRAGGREHSVVDQQRRGWTSGDGGWAPGPPRICGGGGRRGQGCQQGPPSPLHLKPGMHDVVKMCSRGIPREQSELLS